LHGGATTLARSLATADELLPIFEQHHVHVDGDVLYRCAFTLFATWRDRGCA